MQGPLRQALAKVDGMPVEKLENYERWKEARGAILHALNAAIDLERAERRLTADSNKVRRP